MLEAEKKIFSYKNISKLIALNFVIVVVFSVAFLIVIKTFNQIKYVLERDLNQKIETTLGSFVLGKEILHLGEIIHEHENNLLHSPEGMLAGRQEVLAIFDEVLRKIKLTNNYYRFEDTYIILLEYRQALSERMNDNITISRILLQLNLLNDSYLTALAEMEVEAGKLIISEVLAGHDPTGLHQVNALIPFCREKILEAKFLMEKAVVSQAVDEIIAQRENSAKSTVLASIKALLHTLETLTSASPVIAGKAAIILESSSDYLAALENLVATLKLKEIHAGETEKKQKTLVAALSRAEAGMLSDLNRIAETTGSSMSSARKGLYFIAVVVLLISFFSVVLAIFLGQRITAAVAENERSRQLLAEQMDNLGQEIEKRQQAEDVSTELTLQLENLVDQRTVELNSANIELEALVYSMSHDLRTPLRGIAGFSNALLREYSDKIDQTGVHYLHRIEIACINMGKTIDFILELSRSSRAKINKENVNLSSLAGSIVNELKKNHPNRNVEVYIAPDIRVPADLEQMRAVLDSLFSNAWKFTAQIEHPKVSLDLVFEDDKEVVFMVKDNGVGFNMEFKDKMFGAFQRLHSHEEFPGAGIGLALVHRVIHRHGGEVWAEGKEGKGASIYCSLPKD